MSEARPLEGERWHTVAQAATILGVGDDSIRRRLAEFGAVRVGRAYRISDAGIQAFVEAHRVKRVERPVPVRQGPLARTERLRQARERRDRVLAEIR